MGQVFEVLVFVFVFQPFGSIYNAQILSKNLISPKYEFGIDSNNNFGYTKFISSCAIHQVSPLPGVTILITVR